MNYRVLNQYLWVFFFTAFFQSNVFASSIELVQVLTFDGQKLNGHWTLPKGEVKGAVLILQGSGNVGMDGDVSAPLIGSGYGGQPTHPSEQVSNALAAVGIASFRFSKRGYDDSTQLLNQTLDYLEKDALSAFELVQKRFATLPTGVVGFSEGALIATRISARVKFSALYLLAIPTRPIDEVLSYQFLGWPAELLSNKLDSNHDGVLSSSELSVLPQGILPLMGTKWQSIDINQDQSLSFINEVIPAYQNFYFTVRGLLKTPTYQGWYESMKAMPAFEQIAQQIQASTIYLYQGLKDPQVRWNWIVEDLGQFKLKPTLKLFSDYGHGFAPLEGSIGEIKTSGPFSEDLLNQLATDVSVSLK